VTNAYSMDNHELLKPNFINALNLHRCGRNGTGIDGSNLILHF